MVNRTRLIKEFIKYVQIDSESYNEKKFADFLESELIGLGFLVETDNAGEVIGSNANNIIAYLKGDKDSEPIMFSCHIDTVKPGIGIKPQVEQEIICSDGTTILGSDDKSGIAVIFETIRIIRERNIKHGDIEVVFTICEEQGIKGSRYLDYSLIKSKRAVILDSGANPGTIITRAPAKNKINVKIHGKSAHAGVRPEEGISAIEIASHAIYHMNLLRIDEETTANIGIIQGGNATNVVCSEVNIVAEARSLDNQKLEKQTIHMRQCFENAAKKYCSSFQFDIEELYRSYKFDDNDEFVLMLKNAYNNIGIETRTASTGGGSDANHFNTHGIKALNIGVGMKKSHTLEEHINIKDMIRVTNMLVELIKIT